MPDSPDRTHEILLRVADFLKKLPEDQYDALASGDSRLEVVPKNARVTSGTPAKPPVPVTLPVSAETVASELRSIADLGAADRYIDDLRLKRPQLALLAEQFGIAVPSKTTQVEIKRLIVELKVGQRLDTAAILGR